MKCLDFSKAQATPRASPSTGEYRLSAPLVNREPANTKDHPELQHTGVMSVQLHSFCSNVKPIPAFDQSVARHVIFPMSYVRTPFSTALRISSFDFSNASCNSGVQRNSVLGLRRFLNGSIMSDCEKAKLH